MTKKLNSSREEKTENNKCLEFDDKKSPISKSQKNKNNDMPTWFFTNNDSIETASSPKTCTQEIILNPDSSKKSRRKKSKSNADVAADLQSPDNENVKKKKSKSKISITSDPQSVENEKTKKKSKKVNNETNNLQSSKKDKPNWFFSNDTNSPGGESKRAVAKETERQIKNKSLTLFNSIDQTQNVQNETVNERIEGDNPFPESVIDEKIQKTMTEDMKSITTTSNFIVNPNLQNLQQYHIDMALIEMKLVDQSKIVEDLKKELEKQVQLLEEMNIEKKDLVTKIKNVCRGICEGVSDKKKSSLSESSFDDKITEIESTCVQNVSESLPIENICSDSSSDVEIISETLVQSSPKKSAVVVGCKRKYPESSSSESDDDSETPQKMIKKTNDAVSVNRPESIFSADSHSRPALSSVSNDNTSSSSFLDMLPNDNKLQDYKNESIDKSLKLDFDEESLKSVKPDADNGLFNAIEPILNPLTVGDAITDITVFSNRLFVAGLGGLLRQYHLKTHECIMNYIGAQNKINCILATAYPSGVKKLISGGEDKSLFIYNIDTGVILKRVDYDQPINCICDYLDNIYFGTAHGHVLIYSLQKEREMCDITVSASSVSAIAATKEIDRNLLFIGSQNGEYNIWDAKTLIKIRNITPLAHVDVPKGFFILSKQRLLAYTNNYIHFIHYVKMKNTVSLNHFDSINALSLTRNYAIVGTSKGVVSLYKLKGSQIFKTPINSINNGSGEILSLTFYNNTIITGDVKGTIHFNRLFEM